MAAEHVISTIEEEKNIASTYPTALSKSWVFKELYAARNFRPWFKYGLWLGSLATGLEFKIFKKQCWWTLHHSYTDRSKTQTAKKSMRISYPPPDQKIIFDRNSSIYLSNIKYEENQPCNLKLNNPLAFSNSLEIYAAPEQRYCPAGVYEVINKKLHINAGNCIHCKTCDIKDPLNNIRWIPPEGGSGPNYQDM